MVKAIARTAPQALVLTSLVALLLVWGGREQLEPWGTTTGPAYSDADITRWVGESVSDQLAALGCDTTPRLTERVAVRPAPVKGQHVFDQGVVSLVSFDEAFAGATAGSVFIVGWCS